VEPQQGPVKLPEGHPPACRQSGPADPRQQGQGEAFQDPPISCTCGRIRYSVIVSRCPETTCPELCHRTVYCEGSRDCVYMLHPKESAPPPLQYTLSKSAILVNRPVLLATPAPDCHHLQGWFALFASEKEVYLCKDDSISWLSRYNSCPLAITENCTPLQQSTTVQVNDKLDKIDKSTKAKTTCDYIRTYPVISVRE